MPFQVSFKTTFYVECIWSAVIITLSTKASVDFTLICLKQTKSNGRSESSGGSGAHAPNGNVKFKKKYRNKKINVCCGFEFGTWNENLHHENLECSLLRWATLYFVRMP